MHLDLKIFGNKLQNLRKKLDLSINEISLKTGIENERLKNLEDGILEPTGDEVLIFADVFKQNYNYFISNQQKTASDQTDILYRKFGNDFSKEDRWALQEFIFLCESEELVFNNIGYQRTTFEFRPTGSFYKAQGELAAKELRKALGLSDNNIITDPYNTIRKLGIHVFRRKLINSNISGLFINHPWAGKCILINYSENIYRQNFTLAHELGHAIFDSQEQINISFTKWDKNDLKEVRANSFASNLLVPKDIFNQFKINNWNESHILSIANQLKINVEVLLIAMKNSGINTDYNTFKSIKIPKAQNSDPELIGLSEKRLLAKRAAMEKGLSGFYIQHCYEAYSRGLISSGKLAEILLCNERELVDLLKLFMLELSYDN